MDVEGDQIVGLHGREIIGALPIGSLVSLMRAANGARKQTKIEVLPRHPAIADSILQLKWCCTGV